MKRSIKLIALIVLVVMLAGLVFAGCGDLTRKLKGAELSFPNKISGAKKLSFKMNINYRKGETRTEIDMQCYRAANESGQDEYAYVYTAAASLCNSYKNIYADGKLYEIVNVTTNAGSYYVRDDVSVEDEGNILYHITKKIFLIGAAAFVSKAQEETYQGETVYRYDVMVSEKKVTLWYNSEVLVKIFVSIPTETEGEYEQYTIKLSDYAFDAELPTDAFKRPNTYGITYVESPISFEDWTSIVTSFASKLG
ncbi:MAG: hypothetical protein J5765_04330 [Clostridia bacterium]|nr:hypothetical protein [Clostridia bacterium]